MADNLYDILKVSKQASSDDIRQAYRKLARKYHPDVNPGDKRAEDRFKKISAAYDVLGDEERRKAYDEFGEESLKGGFDPEQAREYKKWQNARREGARPFQGSPHGVDWSDLFGFQGGFRSRGGHRGSDVQVVVDMDLRQALSGGEISVDVPGQKPVKVRIPPGADNGSTIRVKGKGANGTGGAQRGDLLIETRVKPHPLLRRDGLHLLMAVPVTLDEAYNGATIEIPTLDGTVKVRVPPRSQTGTKLRLRGKGVPRKQEKGDFIVELVVRLPDQHNEELSSAIKNSQTAYSEPVRKEIQL